MSCKQFFWRFVTDPVEHLTHLFQSTVFFVKEFIVRVPKMMWGLMAIVHSTGRFALEIDATGMHPTTAFIAKIVVIYGVAYVIME